MALAADITLPDIDIIGIAAVIVALGVIYALLKGGNKFFKGINQVIDDWNGTEGDDAHPERPGVMKHFRMIDCELNEHRETQKRIEAKVDDAIHELMTNNGTSLKDSVARIELQQAKDLIERRAFTAQYLEDRQKTREEWIHVFAIVRSMINMDPSAQVAIWDELTAKYKNDTLVNPEDQEL